VQIGAEGQIQYLVDADDEDAAKIMAKNKYVSPEIRCEVVDTRTGHRFAGPSIVHLAVTPNPVQVTGKPHVSLSKSAPVLLHEFDRVGRVQSLSLSKAVYEGKQGWNAKVASAIAELQHELESMGIMFHASATDDALTMLEHMISAVKTHKATKACNPESPEQSHDDYRPVQMSTASSRRPVNRAIVNRLTHGSYDDY
jgi:hypothetical protein